MIRFISILIISGSILFSCGGGKQATASKKVVYDPAPEWVSQRPHDAAYYIGVGSSNKKAQPLDFQTIAKKNALNDLATEISVRVQGETTMNTQEYNKAFSEDFMASIKTSTDAKIDDYEVAGLWENENEYWVFYRLNKGQYQSRIREKKRQALSSANDFLEKGRLAAQEGNINGAFDLFMHGLFAMKDYWSEPNEFETTSGKIFLDNELMSSMRSLFSDLKIEVPQDKIILDSKNSFRQELLLKVFYSGKPARSLPVNYSYEQESFMKPKTQFSSETGEFVVMVEKVSSKSKTNQLKLSIEPENFLAADLDKPLQKAILKGFRIHQVLIPIEFVSPSFYFKSSDSGNNALTLSNGLANEIQKRGFRLAANEKETNYSVGIQTTLKAGGSSDGFVVSYLDVMVEVKEMKTGVIVYREALSGVKGVGLNEAGANNDAFKRGKEKMEQQIAPALCKTLF
jgi:hypothetical protein